MYLTQTLLCNGPLDVEPAISMSSEDLSLSLSPFKKNASHLSLQASGL